VQTRHAVITTQLIGSLVQVRLGWVVRDGRPGFSAPLARPHGYGGEYLYIRVGVAASFDGSCQLEPRRQVLVLVAHCYKRIVTGSRECGPMSNGDLHIGMHDVDLKFARKGSERSRDHDFVDYAPNKSPRAHENTRPSSRQANQRPDENDRISVDGGPPPRGTPEVGKRLAVQFELDDTALPPSSPLPIT